MLAISVLRWTWGRTNASSKSRKREIKTLQWASGLLRLRLVPPPLSRFNAANVSTIRCQWVPCQKSLSQRPQTKNSSQPAVGPGRDALAQGFLGDAAQLAAAAHAARPAEREAELAEDQRQLLGDAQRRRQPEGGNDPVAQEAAFHQHAVRGQDRGRQRPRLAQQFVVGDVRLPGRLVAGRPQPPGQPAQAGIAQEQDRRGLGERAVGKAWLVASCS